MTTIFEEMTRMKDQAFKALDQSLAKIKDNHSEWIEEEVTTTADIQEATNPAPNHFIEMEIFVDEEYEEYCPGDRYTPPTDAKYTLNRVLFRGIDLTAVLSKDEIERISDERQEVIEERLELQH